MVEWKSKNKENMRIDRFEDIEGWQLARELIQKVSRAEIWEFINYLKKTKNQMQSALNRWTPLAQTFLKVQILYIYNGKSKLRIEGKHFIAPGQAWNLFST